MDPKPLYSDFHECNAARMLLENAVRSPNKHSLGWHMASASRYVRTAQAAGIAEHQNLIARLYARCAGQDLPVPWHMALELLLEKETNAFEQSPVSPCEDPAVHWVNAIPIPMLYTTWKRGDCAEDAADCLCREVVRRGFVPGRGIG